MAYDGLGQSEDLVWLFFISRLLPCERVTWDPSTCSSHPDLTLMPAAQDTGLAFMQEVADATPSAEDVARAAKSSLADLCRPRELVRDAQANVGKAYLEGERCPRDASPFRRAGTNVGFDSPLLFNPCKAMVYRRMLSGRSEFFSKRQSRGSAST